jgi:hypothetical protein
VTAIAMTFSALKGHYKWVRVVFVLPLQGKYFSVYSTQGVALG